MMKVLFLVSHKGIFLKKLLFFWILSLFQFLSVWMLTRHLLGWELYDLMNVDNDENCNYNSGYTSHAEVT